MLELLVMNRLPLPVWVALGAGSALLALSAAYWFVQGEAIILALASFVCL